MHFHLPSLPVSPIFLLLLIVLFGTFSSFSFNNLWLLTVFYSLLLESLHFSSCSIFSGILKQSYNFSHHIYAHYSYFSSFFTSTNVHMTLTLNALGNLKPNISKSKHLFSCSKTIIFHLSF